MANGGRSTYRLNQPKELPEAGLTSAQFKPWKTHVLTFLEQDEDSEQFLPGGRYDSWTAASSTAKGARGRLTALFEKPVDDPNDDNFDDRITEDEVKAAANKNDPGRYTAMSQVDKDTLKARLVVNRLKLRNKQLAKTLQMLSSFVFWSTADGITDDATSIEWVWSYLRKYYNIESRGVNFLKIVKIVFKAGENPQTFYKQFRCGFLDNLRKEGDARSHLRPGDKMPADEVLTPSFEDAIILWALEKIDPRLPARVARDYEHRLDKDNHLIDLQSTIFQAVPAMLEALDRDANLQSIASSAAIAPSQPASDYHDDQAVDMNAFYQPGRGRGGRGGRGSGGRGGGSRGGRGSSRGGPRHQPQFSTPDRDWTLKYCRLCKEAGKSEATIASHDTIHCDSLSKAELRAMLAALKLMNLEPNNLDPDEDPAAEGIDYGYDDYQGGQPQGPGATESS